MKVPKYVIEISQNFGINKSDISQETLPIKELFIITSLSKWNKFYLKYFSNNES